MKQYLDLTREIQEKGTYKPAAREGMPGTLSYFGPQMRFDLSKGFPAMTTKKLFFSGVIYELLWFLKGDTNVKYLNENNVYFWNEDAFNRYVKITDNESPSTTLLVKEQHLNRYRRFTFEEFENILKKINFKDLPRCVYSNYTLGDCGYQYGKVWREWGGDLEKIDQIKNLIEGLKKSPEGRRHIVVATDPGHDKQLALYWCHSFFQMNCRPIEFNERLNFLDDSFDKMIISWCESPSDADVKNILYSELEKINAPKYMLDCKMYQRSADLFLGTPLNTASYALLTHILCKICNMVPGEFIHTFGDVHIYDNHTEQITEQLTREPRKLPTLEFSENFEEKLKEYNQSDDLDQFMESLSHKDFILRDYTYHPAIKADLSTGMKVSDRFWHIK